MTQQSSLMRLYARAAYGGDQELTERLVRPIATSMRDVVRALLERGVAQGELRAEVDLEAATGVLHALSIAIADSRLFPTLDAYMQLPTASGDPRDTLHAMLDPSLRGPSV
jgi:hypothetical protein